MANGTKQLQDNRGPFPADHVTIEDHKESNPEMEFAEIPTRSQSAGVLPHEDVLSQAEQSRAERRRLFEEAGFDAL